MPNVKFHRPRPLTPWRKISLGSWRPVGDSSIHCMFEASVEPFARLRAPGTSLNHFLALSIGRAAQAEPAVNSMVRAGKIFSRAHVDVFFHACLGDSDDLTGFKICGVDSMNLTEIAADFEHQRRRIEREGDFQFRHIKRVFRWVPGWFGRTLLNLLGALFYTLNLPASWLGAPNDAFGGIMITNVGRFGIEHGFAPFAPYAHVSTIAAVGAVRKRPWVEDGCIAIARTVRIGFTFDHRTCDGVHIGRFLSVLRRAFEQPETLMGISGRSAG